MAGFSAVAEAVSVTSRPARRASRPIRMSASGPTRSTPSRLNSKRESSVSLAVTMTSPVPFASSSASAPTMTVGADRTMLPEPAVETVIQSPADVPRPSMTMISSVAVMVRPVMPIRSPAMTTRPRERSDSSPSPTSSPGASVSTTWSASAETVAIVKLRLLRPKPRASISWPGLKPSATKSPAARVNEFVARLTSIWMVPVNARVALIVSAPVPVTPVITTPPTKGFGTPVASAPAAKPAGTSTAGRGSNAVRFGPVSTSGTITVSFGSGDGSSPSIG